MSTPYIGEIRIFSFAFAPRGWALCNGQLLAINQNQALFSILGTFYGGNGIQNFALPNLQGRVPRHWGQGAGLSSVVLGESAGTENVTLQASQVPGHTHPVQISTSAATQVSPHNGVWANSGDLSYAASATGSMASAAISTVGSGQPHSTLPPLLVLSFCIALNGIFPTRN